MNKLTSHTNIVRHASSRVLCTAEKIIMKIKQFDKLREYKALVTPCITHPGKSYPSATRAKFGLKLEPKCYPSATMRVLI